MGLFDFLKLRSSKDRFVSESDFDNFLNSQLKMTPQTLNELRKLNVTADKELRLEYFFYTNKAGKAERLENEINKLNYGVESGRSQSDRNVFVISGWTTKMKMDDATVKSWTKQMCELGYKFDCEFDGWGTNPDQA